MAGKSTPEICGPIIDMALDNLACKLVHVWSVDPRREKLVLVAQGCRDKIDDVTMDVIDVSSSYTGLAVETRQPQVHCRLESIGDRRMVNPALRDRLGIRSIVSVPIRNIGNPHQITLVLNLCFDYTVPESFIDPRVLEEIKNYSELFAIIFETNLRERAFRMSARVSLALGHIARLTPESGCSAFARTVREALESDWTTIYLENWNGKELIRQADDPSPSPGESGIANAVIEAWRHNREFLSPNVAREASNVQVVASGAPDVASAILVPLHDVRGRCKGVVRCVNFRPNGAARWRRSHSYDDIAIVESMGRAFAPPLDMLLQSDATDVSLRSLAHELRVPVVALRAVLDRMEREYDAAKTLQFKYPYFTEAHTFTNVMQRLLGQLEIARVGPDRIVLSKQPTRLLADVIQPAIKFMHPVLKQHGMNRQQISHWGFELIPPIEVDRALLTQVVFNLLDNMVKYFPKSRRPDEFRGRIFCKASENDKSVEIAFEDNGPGIDEVDRDQIFQFGFRSQNAMNSNVQGTGLGCWLAKEIAKRHDGDLVVRSVHPFELVLTLPHTRLRKRSFVHS